MEIERIIKKYYEQLDACKFDNLVEMTHNLLKLTQEEKGDLNRHISIKEFNQ